MPYLTVREIDIWFDRAGTGAPLLAISGSRGDLRRKPNLLESPLANAFNVLAYDQRGLGRTSKPDKPYVMADFADDAAALLDAVGWERVRVVGVSFGGMVALELALRHPDRVAKLALCCTSPGGEGGSSYPIHRCRVSPQMSGRGSWCPLPIRDAMRVGRRRIRGNGRNSSENSAMIHSLRNRVIRSESSRLLEARRQHNTWERLDQIGCPVLACGGWYDGIALPSSQERMGGESRGRPCACSKVAIYFSGRIAPRSPRSSGFLRNEETG